MSLRFLCFPGLFVVLFGAASCGDDDDGGSSCGFAACGGDIEGTWDFVDVCSQTDLVAEANASIEDPDCQDIFKRVDLSVSGSATFNADGTASGTLAITTTMELEVTARCTGVEPSTLVCNAVQTQLASSTGFSVACSFASGACACNVTNAVTSPISGTYQLEGSTIVTDDGEATEYCVNGATLKLLLDEDETNLVMTLQKRG
jgi:hypothetical protein